METYEIQFNDETPTVTTSEWAHVMNYVHYDDVRRITVFRDGVADYTINVHMGE